MVELPKEACWNSDDVAAVISNEALEGHEGIFLATHTPIRDFEVTGSHAGEIDGRDEQAVLLALSDPSRSHAFCVVQGEPGSGKSHQNGSASCRERVSVRVDVGGGRSIKKKKYEDIIDTQVSTTT